MIMGDTCTRACIFCNVKTGCRGRSTTRSLSASPKRSLSSGWRNVAVPADGDDLPEGGARHFAEMIRAIRDRPPLTTIEVLTPDFLRKEGALEIVVASAWTPRSNPVSETTEHIGAEATQFEPRGTLSIRTLAMPADTNQYGDIFGGWLLGQMDIAGGIFAATIAKGRTATVAVDAMTFRKPVYVGDVMCIYTDLIRVGTTSITIHVQAWVIRRDQTTRFLVTKGNFTYVALDDERRPLRVQQ
jgi:acyl-CoA thioesterase YciA